MHKADLLNDKHLCIIDVKGFIDLACGTLAKQITLLPLYLFAIDLTWLVSLLLIIILLVVLTYEIILHLLSQLCL